MNFSIRCRHANWVNESFSFFWLVFSTGRICSEISILNAQKILNIEKAYETEKEFLRWISLQLIHLNSTPGKRIEKRNTAMESKWGQFEEQVKPDANINKYFVKWQSNSEWITAISIFIAFSFAIYILKSWTNKTMSGAHSWVDIQKENGVLQWLSEMI